MLHWFGLACFVAGVVGVVRWWSRRTDALGRRRPLPWFTVGVLVVTGGAALLPWIARTRLEGRLSSAATALARRSVEVRCQSVEGTFLDAGADLGHVDFGPDGIPERAAVIKLDQCRALSDYLDARGRRPSRPQVVAVHVLTHETVHMAGVTSESETECLALQRDAEMARLLGASDRSARELAVSYWHEVYPRMSMQYRSNECRSGGALDAGLPDAPWDLAE